ncbi:MAG: hypothetical protein RLY86_1300 [Pseudomonadota bacterium]|jgi:SulP family sulfate permease
MQPTPGPAPSWRLLIPKSVTVLWTEGYRLDDLRADALAGLTVAIVALPLAMAIAIASGVTPAAGLVTAVVAGFLISALGGSRFQIGGPTGAFIVVVYGVIQAHGLDGLLLATMMAGALLIAAGLLRLGTWIRYVPEPVVTGFTAGIAVIIFTSQIADLFGLTAERMPADFLEKLAALWAARDSVNPAALLVAGGALATILLLRRFAPKWPGFLIAVAGSALAVAVTGAGVETIGSRFGGVPATFPSPTLPPISLERMGDLMPAAFTIAFLAGLESLLSAMVADGMTGRRHRSNMELVAQGVANLASPLFGGISATGAIARTATNVRAGGRTPVAGMLHAVFVLAFMLGLGPLLAHVPLASLAAVLTVVAWNMSEQERFRHLLSGLPGDRAVLLATFGLTVLVDLTVAIEVGIVLAAIIFMHRMAEATAVESGIGAGGVLGGALGGEEIDDLANPRQPYRNRLRVPDGVGVFELHGPLFFGAASRIGDAFDAAFPAPSVFVLRFRDVPLADASGMAALTRFLDRCARQGVPVILTEMPARTRLTLSREGILKRPGVHVAASFARALDQAAARAAGHGSDPGAQSGGQSGADGKATPPSA